jgi:L-malate glycosyltransferase
MKNILLISNMYPSKKQPSYGIFVKNFEEAMAGRSLAIVSKVVIQGRGSSVLHKTYKYARFFFSVLCKGLYLKYDILYVHYINHTALPVFLLSLLKPRAKLILNSHGGDVVHQSTFARLIFPLARLNIKKASLIVAPSSYFKEIIQKTFNHYKNNIFISPSGGVNLKLFYPIAQERKSDFIQLGFVGRIDSGKGWEIYLKAVSLLVHELGFNVTAHVIGGGSQKDAFDDMIKLLNISCSIVYHGRVPQNKLVEYYNMFDVFIFPSAQESLGLVGIEAMACGIPVIGSNIGGISSYLENGKHGFLFENQNANDLAHKIIIYQGLSLDLKSQMKSNVLNKAKEFDCLKVADDLTNIIVNMKHD